MGLGGPPPARISAYEVRLDDGAEEDERDPKELELEKYGDRADNYNLFGGGPPAPVPDEEAFNVAIAELAEEAVVPDVVKETFATHAASFAETPVVPELNALEIVPLEGIREKKVKEIALIVSYALMSDNTVKKIREVFEDHAGEIPVSVTITGLPADVEATSERKELRLRINHHFRVQPGPALTVALARLQVDTRYVF